MRSYIIRLLVLLAVPVTVIACEGDCIVGITNAWLGNFTQPVNTVLNTIAADISNMLPHHPGTDETMKYLQPIVDSYKANAYAGMETAIFPNYFHGKCQQESLGGADPPGCPNPDCPVVCGTPGSLVHFFGKLRYIAFNQTSHLLKTSATPGQLPYQRSEKMVIDAANANAKRMLSMRMFYARASLDGTTPAHDWLTARADDVKTQFKQIMAQLEPLMLNICGGTDGGDTNGLPNCSWEDAMKAYILSFP